MRARVLAAALGLAAVQAWAITPYFTDTFGGSSWTNWQMNGTLSRGSNRLTTADAVGGSVINTYQPAGWTGYTEVVTTLRLAQAGGRYTVLARATADARHGTGATGSYYALDFANVTNTAGWRGDMSVVKRVNGVVTTLASWPALGLRDGMEIRILVRPYGGNCMYSVMLDRVHYYYVNVDPAMTGWLTGLGVAGAPAVNGFDQVQLNLYESTAPPAVDRQTVSSSLLPASVDLRWKGVVDPANGSGLWRYDIYRNGAYLQSVERPEFTDGTVTAGTSYTYWIVSTDYHQNGSALATVALTAPAAGTVTDARRTASFACGFGGQGVARTST